MNIDIAKINTSLEGIKKHSDEIELNTEDGQSLEELEKELESLNQKS